MSKATVILVSDGKETCDLDPCEVGKALEAAGVDFTAHVVGFDIATARDRQQLQCLAENTGGTYFNASNAAELSQALEQTVVQNPEPEPEPPTRLTMKATELEGGVSIASGLQWTVQQAGGGDTLFRADSAGDASTELPPGVYDIYVERTSDGLKGKVLRFELMRGQGREVVIPLEFELAATVRTEPKDEAPVSSEVVICWTGPQRQGDYVTITKPSASDGTYTGYKYVAKSGNPTKLRLPAEAGDYEVRYILSKPKRVLARARITAVALEASLQAADQVPANSTFDVTWQGPGYQDDWVTIVKPEARDKAYLSYQYTKKGNPLTLRAPLEAGPYELRYVQAGQKVIARRPIHVTAVQATISGPETAEIASSQPITWTGPGGDGDWVTIVKPSARDRAYTSYQYTKKGNPLTLLMPKEPGLYEFRYVQQGKVVLARRRITVTDIEVSLDAPERADVGEVVQLTWDGPAKKGDWLTVVAPGASAKSYTDYQYVDKGSPVDIVMPDQPGDYEFRYVLLGQRVMSRKAIQVVDVSADVEGPETVKLGAAFQVSWQGPAHPRDLITIAKPESKPRHYLKKVHAIDGSPTTLHAPRKVGAYELRYIVASTRIVARRAIEVVE